MSRRRQKPNEIDLWLFPLNTTDTSNHIENSWNAIGHHFTAEYLGDKIREEKDVLSGRVLQSTTVEQYRTRSELTFNIGDNVSTIPNPNEFEQSTIVRLSSKPIKARGTRYNTVQPRITILEVS